MATPLTTYRATLGSLLFNCRWSGGVLVDDSGTLTLNNGGTPTTNSGAGLDGQDLATFNGTNQGVDMSAAAGVAFIAAIEAGGVEVGVDVIHSSTANKDKLLATYSGAGNNACDIQFNADSNFNYSATGGIAILLKDNAGTSKIFFFDLNTVKLHTDGLVHRYHFVITKTSCSLYVEGTLFGTTTGSAATLGSFTSGSAGKLVFSGYGFGGSATFNADSFNGSAGNLFGRTATLTEAQRRADVGIGNSSVDGTPLAWTWRADTALFNDTAPVEILATDLQSVEGWNNTQLSVLMSEASSFDPGPADAQSRPYLLIADNHNVPTVSFDNAFASGSFDADSNLTGHRRQAMRFTGLAASLQFKCSNCTMYFAGRLPTYKQLGVTTQLLIGLYEGSSLRAALAYIGGRIVLIDSNGSTTRDALTTDVLDSRNGPSLVYAEVSIKPDGSCTIQMNRWSGATTASVSVGNHKIDGIRFGGSPESHGEMACMLACEIGICKTASTSTERATRLARIFSKYPTGWGKTGETPNPRNHITGPADSLNHTYGDHLRGYLMCLPEAAVNSTSWCIRAVDGKAIVATSGTNDAVSNTPNAAAKKDPAAVRLIFLCLVCTNDALQSDSGAQINTDLGTLLALLSGFTDITVMGLATNSIADNVRTAYQTAIDARVGSTITRSIAPRNTDAVEALDGLHFTRAGHQQYGHDLWFGGSGGLGGGLSAAAPEFAVGGGGRLGRDRADRRAMVASA